MKESVKDDGLILQITERYIGVNEGYLGDFSSKTHKEFYSLYCGLDKDTEALVGTTRERFIQIFQGATSQERAKIIRGVMERFPLGEGPKTRTVELRDSLLREALRLESIELTQDRAKVSPAQTMDHIDEIICSRCDQRTSHEIVRSVERHDRDEYVQTMTTCEILCCRGCHEFSFRKRYLNSEDPLIDDGEGGYIPDEKIELYPRRIKGRKIMDEIQMLPPELSRIYRETHEAFCARLEILAFMGLRALVESVCRDKKAKGHTLFHKIDHLVAQQILTPNDAKMLHGIRDWGNDSAHELRADGNNLDLAMEIVESLLKTVYIIPQKLGVSSTGKNSL